MESIKIKPRARATDIEYFVFPEATNLNGCVMSPATPDKDASTNVHFPETVVLSRSPAGIRQGPTLSVVMPVFNEHATLEEILFRVQAVDIDKEIVIIDDGSTDGSRALLADLASRIQTNSGVVTLTGRSMRGDNIRIFFQPENYGKGAAVRRGFQEARGELVIVQDADLELNPQDYYELIKPIQQGMADVVYGSRFLGRRRQKSVSLYYLGNHFLTALSNAITGLHVTDVWVGYKVFRREVLQKIRLREDRFGFEPEVTAKVAKLGCRVVEVPVSYAARSREEGKKIGWRDAVRGVWCTLRYTLLRDSPT